MSLVSDLLASIEDAPALTVQRSVVGPRFFGVALGEARFGASSNARDDGVGDAARLWSGVAFLGQHQRPSSDLVETTLRAAQGRPAAAIAGWLLEGEAGGADLPRETLVRTAIGAATLNALLAQQLAAQGTALGEENGLDVLAQAGAGKRLAVVGGFPYLEEIRAKAAQSWILELDPDEDHVPASAAPEVLPQADVVGITGSTLANGTLSGLLELCRPDAFVVLIGPTTPISPVLFQYGATALCGIASDDTERVFASIVQEGSTRRIPGTHAVSLRR
jgi:uncharacterized protein